VLETFGKVLPTRHGTRDVPALLKSEGKERRDRFLENGKANNAKAIWDPAGNKADRKMKAENADSQDAFFKSFGRANKKRKKRITLSVNKERTTLEERGFGR
jgi:hypothetical protein